MVTTTTLETKVFWYGRGQETFECAQYDAQEQILKWKVQGWGVSETHDKQRGKITVERKAKI